MFMLPVEQHTSNGFPSATIMWKKEETCSKPRKAWVFASTRMRWKHKSSSNEKPPKEISEFRGQNYVAIERLDEDATWDDILNVVKPVPLSELQTTDSEGYALSIHGSTLIKPVPLATRKEVIVVVKDVKLRDSWVDLYRIFSAPWKLLYRTLVEDRALGSTLSNDVLRSMLTTTEDQSGSLPSSSSEPKKFKKHVDEFGLVPNTAKTMSGFVSSVASFLQRSSEFASSPAVQTVANTAKCITIVGSAFQVVACITTLIDMGMEVHRAKHELVRITSKVQSLRGKIMQSIIPVLHPDCQIDLLLMKDIFKVQEQAVSILMDVEKQMMSLIVVQYLKAEGLKEIEKAVVQLENCVVSAVQSAEIAGIHVHFKMQDTRLKHFDERLNCVTSSIDRIAISVDKNSEHLSGVLAESKRNSSRISTSVAAIASNTEELGNINSELAEHSIAILELQKERAAIPNLSDPPKLSPFFAGREKELENLRVTLEKYGSCAITQYGGAGKTQLAVAFFCESEKKKLVPGGAYWIRAHGNRFQFMLSLAEFVEAMTGQTFREKDQRDLGVVIRRLKEKLTSLTGRWLLVLDNADDPWSQDVIREICSLTADSLVGGWVLVTSRLGNRKLWDGMESEQRLILEPLSQKESMIVLWRHKKNLPFNKHETSVVLADLERLKKENPLEHDSLSQLAGRRGSKSLGGLALALAQAGSFLYGKGFSFEQYAKLYESKRLSDEIALMFPNVNDRSLEMKNQGSIWTTWKINIDQLSTIARGVLDSFALFESSHVPAEIVKLIDPKLAIDVLNYVCVIREELVDGASLLQEIETPDGNVLYDMHRLLHEFMLIEMKKDAKRFHVALQRALQAVNCYVHKHVDLPIKSYAQIKNSHVSISAQHTISILLHFKNEYLENVEVDDDLTPSHFNLGSDEVSVLFILAISHLRLQGRTIDAEPLCERLSDLLFKRKDAVLRTKFDIFCRAMSEMGSVFRDNANNEHARLYFGILLFMQHSAYKKDPKDFSYRRLAFSLNQMGELTLEKGDYLEARSLFYQSLILKLVAMAQFSDHPAVAVSLYQMGMVSKVLESEAIAGLWFDKSLQMMERLCKNNNHHPDMIVLLNNIGLLMKESRMTFAFVAGIRSIRNPEKCFTQSLEILNRLHGVNVVHSIKASIMHNLGSVFLEQCNLEKAEQFLLNSLNMKKKLYGNSADHPSLVSTLHQIGLLAHEKGAFRDAEKEYNKALKMMRRLYGHDTDRLDIAVTLRCLGILRQEKVVSTDFDPFTRQSAEMYARIYGLDLDHEKVTQSLGVMTHTSNSILRSDYGIFPL